MIYKVKAKFNYDKAKKFYDLLQSDKLKNQRPDGYEIIASMKRAKVGKDGFVHWTEMCFCPTPLAHERATVYNKYFTEIETEEVKGYEKLKGKSFYSLLAA